MITNAVLLPTGASVTPEEILIDTDNYADSVAEIVGGIFEPVHLDTPEGHIVGYVNENFIADGLEYNYLATALFGKAMQGNVVVVWSQSESDYYMNEMRDVPAEFVEFLNGPFLETVAESYNISVGMAVLFEMAIEAGTITVMEGAFVGRALHENAEGTITADDEEKLNEILDRVNEWGKSLDELAMMRYIVEKADEQNDSE